MSRAVDSTTGASTLSRVPGRVAQAKLADQLLGSQQLEGQLEALSQVFQLLRSASAPAAAKKSSSSGLLGWLGAWISVQRYLRRLKVGGRLGR